MKSTSDVVLGHNRFEMVRVELECAWCAREVQEVGQMDHASNRLYLSPLSEGLQIAGGRPICKVCRGPMFIGNWRSLHDTRQAADGTGEEESRVDAVA